MLDRSFSIFNNKLNYAIKIYTDPLNQCNLIRDENNGKIGIYSWVNKINGKYYIGSFFFLLLHVTLIKRLF